MKLDLAYVLQAETEGAYVKVGKTGSPKARIYGIRQSLPFPVRVICLLKDGSKTEKEMKALLKPWQVKGEWFTPCPELASYLQECAATLRVVEFAAVDETYFATVLRPKIIGYVNGRELKKTSGGDLVYRMLNGEPLAFVGREKLLAEACRDTFFPEELYGWRAVAQFEPLILSSVLHPKRQANAA